MKKNTKRILIIAAIIIVAVTIWLLASKKKEKQVELPTEVPAYGYIAQTVTATGTIQPVDTVAVGTQVSGIVKVINADFNSKVKKGQLLAQLDKSLFAGNGRPGQRYLAHTAKASWCITRVFLTGKSYCMAAVLLVNKITNQL